jgi:hypothetical protein
LEVKLKKISFVFVLMMVLFTLAAGCAPGTVIQITTLEPNTQSSTPAPTGQVNEPGGSIQLSAPGPNPLINTLDANGRVAGILLGFVHGIISPVTLIISFFNKAVQIYEVHNNGSLYNLGFVLGVAIVFAILGAILGSRRR